MVRNTHLLLLSVTAAALLGMVWPGLVSAAPRHTAREAFEDFDSLVHLLPADPGSYWAIPNADSIQYFGSSCDPENTACILHGSESGVTFARLQISHDPSPAGYDNADLAGIPSGATSGSGDQLWCVAQDRPLTMEYRARWSSGYSQPGSGDVAVGSSGFGAWSNPVTPEGELEAFSSAFFQWVDGFGLSTMVTKGTGNHTHLLSFEPVAPQLSMQEWNQFKIEIVQLLAGDQVTFYVEIDGVYLPVNTVVVPAAIGCLSMENWNDIQSYDLLRNVILQNLPAGETQSMDLDWYRFSQP